MPTKKQTEEDDLGTTSLYKSSARLVFRVGDAQAFCLYLYAFSLNIQFFDPLQSGGTFSFAKITGILYVISLVPSFSKYMVLIRPTIRFIWPAFALFFVITIMSMINVNALSSTYFDTAFFLNLFLFVLIINHTLKNDRLMDNAMLAFALGAVLVAIFMFFSIGTATDEMGRATVFGANQNYMGIKAAAALIIILYYLYNKTSHTIRFRLPFLCFLPILFLSIIGSGSRSGFLAAVLGILAFWFSLNQNRSIGSAKFYFLSFFVLILGAVYILQSDLMVSRLAFTSPEGHNTGLDKLGGRLRIWTTYIDLALDNLILGIGMTGFQQEATRLLGAAWGAHNVILEVMLYSGLVGLFFYLFFLFQVVRATVEMLRHNSNGLGFFLLPPLLAYVLGNQALGLKISWFLIAFIITSYCSGLRNKKKGVF